MNKISFLTTGFLLLTGMQLLAQPVLILKDSIGSGLETSGNGDVYGPQGMAVDPDGNIYVAEEYNNRIQKFDKNGNFLLKFGSGAAAPVRTKATEPLMSRPTGIARDSNGNLFITNRSNNTVYKYDKDGTYIKTIGTTSASSDNGDFNSPVGIAIDSKDNIYVVDRFNDRIQKLDNDGTFIKAIGSDGDGDGQFRAPYGIAIDKEDNIYVVDTERDNLQKFDSDGTFLSSIGGSGVGDGKFSNPAGIAVDSKGNSYVSDITTDSIQVFSPSGSFIKKYDTPIPFISYPAGARVQADLVFQKTVFFIAFDVKDNFYISGNDNHRIYVFATQQEINVKIGETDVASTGSVDFGSFEVGQSKDTTFIIENLGGTDLKLSGTTSSQVIKSGVNASDFTVAQTAVTDEITGFSQVTFTVSFTAGDLGERKATLTLQSDDPDESTYTIDLTANVVAPEINLKNGDSELASGDVIDLGSVEIGKSTDMTTLTVENKGTSDLKLTGTAGSLIAVSGANATDFTVVQTEVVSTFAPNSSAAFTVKYTASTEGTANAVLTLTNNDSDESSYTIVLKGEGAAPVLSVGVDDRLNNTIFPNPSLSGLVNLHLAEQMSGNLSVTNIQGKIITQQPILRSNQAMVDLSKETAGLYFISIEGVNQKPIQFKFLKK
ncbi:choice-of-anchor D domain-containing protein [Reichenbachiella sp.]|uniref:choice-of-anchor D domain-containing protein n=1 Tax=Reichenbachiella sp. TaxID=2184521 RepID=UPI003296F1DF